MVITKTADEAIITARNAAYEGADAFGYQICRMAPEQRTEEQIRRVLRYMNGRPVYITNYRHGFNKDKSDEQLGDELVDLAKWGATLCDVMGDYSHREENELTMDAAAIDKQRRLIDRIHEAGGEVLMSSHVLKYTPAEEVLRIAFEQQKRGADVVKIVTAANSEAEEMENLRITTLLKKELDIPFLFLSGGTHNRFHRMIGPALGCVMGLCVQKYDALSSKDQPLLRAARAVLDNFDYMPKERL
ncbi:MAG: type I 3-dehydroquinate dehydratase [Clostridia bacterium]|nr:type I 3-dehydroquinate dehydratase [Clostridia bacterium]